MSDPYEEIRQRRARLARIESSVAGSDPETRTWTTSEIANRDTWNANRDAILKASREGRIVESEPVAPPPPPVYPPESEFPGLRQTGPNMYTSIEKEAKQ